MRLETALFVVVAASFVGGPARAQTVSEMSDVEDYRLRYIRADGSEAEEQVTIWAREGLRALVEDVLEGSDIGVKAVSRSGLEGWDWAWVTVP